MKFDMNINSIYIRCNWPVVCVDKKYLFIPHAQWFEGFRLNVDLTADYVMKEYWPNWLCKKGWRKYLLPKYQYLGDGPFQFRRWKGNLLLLQLLILRQLYVSGAVRYGADIGGRDMEGVGLRPLPWRELRFQILPGAWMSLVSVVHCQVEVSVTGRSLVQRRPTVCGMSECDRGTSKRRPRLTRPIEPWEENKVNLAWYCRVSAEQLYSEGHTENIVSRSITRNSFWM